jgi:hypothetical protein
MSVNAANAEMMCFIVIRLLLLAGGVRPARHMLPNIKNCRLSGSNCTILAKRR